MPRPRRTKVASKGARVVTSSEDIPTSNASKPSKTDSMAPLKRSRGGAAKFKSTKETEKIDSSGERTQKKAAKRAPRKPAKAKNFPPIINDDDDEVEDERTGALDVLKSRLSTGKIGERISPRPAAKSRTPPNDRSDERERLSPRMSARIWPRISATPQARRGSILRGRTPSVQPNTDDDLYGLSPGGKASQARLGARRSSILRAPLSALKVQGTPGMETSILALTNFKRRARQPSMIRMVQQSSELGKEDEDAYLGVDLELDDTLRDFDNFMPEDESTPLNFGKKKQNIGSVDKQPPPEVDEPRTSSSRKRKRVEAEEEIQIPGSSPYGSSPPRIAGTTWARSSRSSSLPEEHIIASTEEQDPIFAEPLSQSDIMAPPRSSNEPASPKRQKTRGKALAPKGGKPTRQQQAKKAPKMSTAHLQSLLPKPRAKAGARAARTTATYDIPSDSELDPTLDLPEHDDELSRPSVRRRAASRTTKTPLAKKDANRRLGKKINSPAATTKAKQKRTYGRQRSVEKENDESAIVNSDIEDEDTIEIDVDEKIARVKSSKSKELEKARKMFAAVDEWEMEFESVDLGGGESSPWR